ncbi:hypothetical protein D3C73_1383900 [compost metagenome]
MADGTVRPAERTLRTDVSLQKNWLGYILGQDHAAVKVPLRLSRLPNLQGDSQADSIALREQIPLLDVEGGRPFHRGLNEDPEHLYRIPILAFAVWQRKGKVLL